MNTGCFKGLVLLPLTAVTALGAKIVVDDPDGALGATHAPVTTTVKLSRSDRRAADLGWLWVSEVSSPLSNPERVQLFPTKEAGEPERICWLMPAAVPRQRGKRTFVLHKMRGGAVPVAHAKRDSESGQFDITDDGKPVLRYNYATVEPGDIVEKVAPNSRIYARARSDYIHPLYGLDGETLTKDWSVDHPHHRGIYWAWPEVDWRGNRGDLHALQHVFARPTGKCKTISGPVFGQIEAENAWKWGDTNAIVHERAVIRAYRANGDNRIIDLEFQFEALNESVFLARRGTDKYGGLNIRLAGVEGQEIMPHTDATNTEPRMAWAELYGKFDAASQPSGILVLQNSANPDYPGEWVQFPNLNWFQPTFPASGTRYELKKGQPLVLRFRLCLRRGSKAAEDACAVQWRAYHAPSAPRFFQ